MSNIVEQINTASSNNFQLAFSKLPIDDFVDRSLMLYIYDTIIPGVSFNEATINWQGWKHKLITDSLNYDPWSVNFTVDEKWENWNKILEWLKSINNNKDIAGSNIGTYAIDASLIIYDNYERRVMNIKFSSIAPITLEAVTLSYRDGESYLESGCTFVYDYFEIERM